MTLSELLLLRGGWTPAQLGLPGGVYGPEAPAGIPCRGQLYSHRAEDARARAAAPRLNAGRAPESFAKSTARLDRESRRAEAQRQSERDLVRAAERERDERRMRELDARIAAGGGWK